MAELPASVRLFLLLLALLLPAGLILLHFPVQMAAAWQVRWMVYAAHALWMLVTPLLAVRGLLLAVAGLRQHNGQNRLELLGLAGHGLALLLWLYGAISLWPILWRY
ncbi:hypothetical protein CO613_02880 [Lysobacteraceae bacterium NML07-0707]|nr:hypothetical protein CO613_02880 [Xanthomonadaceae bacterium NML07-0707]